MGKVCKNICMLVVLVWALGMSNVQYVKANTDVDQLPTIELNPSATTGNQETVQPSVAENPTTDMSADNTISAEGTQEESQTKIQLSTGVLVFGIVLAVAVAIVLFFCVRALKNRKDKRGKQADNSRHNFNMMGGTGSIWQEIVRLTDINDPERVLCVAFDSTKDRGTAMIGSGRTKHVDVRIADDPTVSDLHCKLTKKGRMFYVTDLNSTNGTKINGNKIYEETTILSGDTIKIGNHVYSITISSTQPHSRKR